MTPLMMKAVTLTRLVLTPSASAASSFSRTATMERPRGVDRIHHTRMATSSSTDRANHAYRCGVFNGMKKGVRLMPVIPSGPPVTSVQLVATRVKMS